jgi:hypothetical protein
MIRGALAVFFRGLLSVLFINAHPRHSDSASGKCVVAYSNSIGLATPTQVPQRSSDSAIGSGMSQRGHLWLETLWPGLLDFLLVVRVLLFIQLD